MMMENKPMASWWKGLIPIILTTMLFFFAMRTIGNSAEGAENGLTSRQKLLEKIPESAVLAWTQAPAEDPIFTWSIDKTSRVCPCEIISAPIGTITLTIASVGKDIKNVFLLYTGMVIARIDFEDDAPVMENEYLTSAQVEMYSKFASDMIDIVMEKFQIASDKDLENLISLLLIANGAIEI